MDTQNIEQTVIEIKKEEEKAKIGNIVLVEIFFSLLMFLTLLIIGFDVLGMTNHFYYSILMFTMPIIICIIFLFSLYFLLRYIYLKIKKGEVSVVRSVRNHFFKFFVLLIIAIFLWGFAGVTQATFKPVIYLYPQTKQLVSVELNYNGKIIVDYPKYDELKKGWTVTAFPDGKIVDSDGKEYSYLFWEGTPEKDVKYNLNTGFIVKGDDTVEFLQNILPQFGLTPKEYNEFIVYWYPVMKNNKYNLIHFADKEYTDNAILNINPKPNSILRVFMVFKPLNNKVEVEPQEIKPFVRNGFTVVEWGGSEI